MKRLIFAFILIHLSLLFASPFNSNLTSEELNDVNNGQLLIKNIEFFKYMSLENDEDPLAKNLRNNIKDLAPKYLVELIKKVPYEGHENLPKDLEIIVNDVPSYAGIPYFSEENQKWFDLFSYASITSTNDDGDTSLINAKITMDPFDVMDQRIEIYRGEDKILYITINENILSYHHILDCIWPERMKIAILVFRDTDGDWLLYGIGGVRAPRFPVFHKRIQVSFINRIKTLCLYFFEQLNIK